MHDTGSGEGRSGMGADHGKKETGRMKERERGMKGEEEGGSMRGRKKGRRRRRSGRGREEVKLKSKSGEHHDTGSKP